MLFPYKHRRKPPRRIQDFSRLVVPLGFGLGFGVCALGFIHFTQITLYKQAHFAPGAEHPDDGYAAGCLFLGLLALAGILLALREPPPMRWRRAGRKGTRRTRQKPAKRMRHSGTIGTQ